MKVYAGLAGPGIIGLMQEDETEITEYKWKRGERVRARNIFLMLEKAVAPRDVYDLEGDEEIELNITQADVEMIERISGINPTKRRTNV